MAVSAVPAVTRHLFTVEDYLRMAESGILHEDSRVELIEGEIVDMSPIGRWHIFCINLLTDRFASTLSRRAIVQVQSSVRLSQRSQPQPDIALLRWRSDFYRHTDAGPPDVLLVIEVADTSLAYDRDVKSLLYARAGIQEYWLVDLNGQSVTIYRSPSPSGYNDVTEGRGADRISPLEFSEPVLAVKEIVGESE